jgi:hypothetical protein
MIMKNRALRGDVRFDMKSKPKAGGALFPVQGSGRRRSSLGMRGKRVSSTGNGLCRKLHAFTSTSLHFGSNMVSHVYLHFRIDLYQTRLWCV